LHAKAPAQKITVTGKLDRVMAIGGESTGWAIQLDSEAAIDGKQVNSIEVASTPDRPSGDGVSNVRAGRMGSAGAEQRDAANEMRPMRRKSRRRRTPCRQPL